MDNQVVFYKRFIDLAKFVTVYPLQNTHSLSLDKWSLKL